MVKASSKSSLPPPAPAARKATAKQGVSVSVRVPVAPAKVPQASDAQSKAYHAFMDATAGATSETLLVALARQGVTADMLVHRAVVAANYSAHAHPMNPKTPVIRELARLDLKKLAADCAAQMKRQRR
jgi:hypothetical protein